MDIGIQQSAGLTLGRSLPAGDEPTPFRVLELVLTVGAIIFLAPFLVLIAILIRIDTRGPSLFKQDRVGRDGRVFKCLKFRSMAPDADVRLIRLLLSDPAARDEWERTQKLRHDPRITTVGRFLRRSSLDELPQLFNVLRGEMSLVGPRPIVASEMKYYGRHMAAYHRVRPGISGLWQVSGRSDTSYRRRVACDVLYVRKKSFALDVKIVMATVPAVLTSKGAR